MSAGHPGASFTLRAHAGLLRALVTDCGFCVGFDPHVAPPPVHPPFETVKAIWDTGATNSVITQAVVDRCSLKPISLRQVSGVNGLHTAEVYIVNVRLPNGVAFQQIEVTQGILGNGIDALIGMDLITRGDFVVSNKGGVTVFTFRCPSTLDMDFARDSRPQVSASRGAAPTPNQLKRARRKK